MKRIATLSFLGVAALLASGIQMHSAAVAPGSAQAGTSTGKINIGSLSSIMGGESKESSKKPLTKLMLGGTELNGYCRGKLEQTGLDSLQKSFTAGLQRCGSAASGATDGLAGALCGIRAYRDLHEACVQMTKDTLAGRMCCQKLQGELFKQQAEAGHRASPGA